LKAGGKNMDNKKSKKRTISKPSMFMFSLMIVIVAVSIIVFASKIMEYNKLKEQQTEIQAQIDAYNSSIEELEYLLSSPMSREYVIRIAREKLGLYLPEEIIFYNNLND
jgi:cell division protein FtsL